MSLINVDGREDPNGGVFYNRYDRVRVEFTWKDRVKKEMESRHEAKNQMGDANEKNFQMNLLNANGSSGLMSLKHSHNRIEMVTEKEIKQSPQTRMSLKGLDPDSMEVMAIKHIYKRPTEKFDVPFLSSQDVGWLLANPVRSHVLEPGKVPRKGRKTVPTRPRDAARTDSELLGGSSVSRLSAYSPKTSSMPTSANAMQRTRSEPHLLRGPKMEEINFLNNRKWYRPKSTCDVTQYASAYVTLMKHDPFNQKMAGR